MGASAAETVKEIEETRDRLGRNLQQLQERLPEPKAVSKRIVVVAVGVAAIWLTFRVAQLLQHRRLNRALLAKR